MSFVINGERKSYLPTKIVNGEQVVRWRQSLGLSQSQLAGVLGRTRECVSLWERGKQKPPVWLYTWFLGFKYRKRLWGSHGPKRIDKDTIEQIMQAYLQGEKTSVISAQFGVGRHYPGQMAKRLGLPYRPPYRTANQRSSNVVS